MFQTSEFGTASVMSACMWSPGDTLKFEIVRPGPGMTSHQAEYEALPFASTSCSVPSWISVASVALQPESMQPPPIPIHVDEYSSWPRVCDVAVGTIQSPEIELKSLLPF